MDPFWGPLDLGLAMRGGLLAHAQLRRGVGGMSSVTFTFCLGRDAQAKVVAGTARLQVGLRGCLVCIRSGRVWHTLRC